MTEITIMVSGPVGIGKSALLHEIEIALKAIGVPVRYADPEKMRAEKNAVDMGDAIDLARKSGAVLIEDVSPTNPLTPSAILLAAADLIEQTGWTQESPAADEQGYPVRSHSPAACRFCVTEAIRRSCPDYPNDDLDIAAMKRLERHLGTLDLPAWNDAPGRTKEEVVAALREAAR